MKTIIFATSNETKAKRFSKKLLENDIEVLSLKDLDMKLDIEENGDSAVENAILKAKECYKKTNKQCMGMDDTLYIENVPEIEQPGLYVRRKDNRVLSDDEMMDYYINLVKKYGLNGRLNCKWIYGLAVINDRGECNTYSWSKDNFYLTDTKSKIVNKGYPLNSISKYKNNNKFFTEMTEEDNKKIKYNEDHVVNFIVNNI